MGILDRFRKKKKEEEKTEEVKEIITDLEKLCGNDRETYEALLNTMLLDPRRIGTSMEDTAKKAEELEKIWQSNKRESDRIEARKWYQTAGGLAIYGGNVAKVKQYFGKCKKLFPNTDYPILEIPERAVKKAQEYYQKYLKEEEKK